MTDTIHGYPTLLLVDDDHTYCRVMAASLRKRQLNVLVAHDVPQALQLVGDIPPKYAMVDLNMPGNSGLVLVEKLHAIDPKLHIVVVTGYASISTAVDAIKLGAQHYLTKPADADEILTALELKHINANRPVVAQPFSPRRLEWEHIQKVLHQCDGNISEAARLLSMHRRTLQRKLQKKPVER